MDEQTRAGEVAAIRTLVKLELSLGKKPAEIQREVGFPSISTVKHLLTGKHAPTDATLARWRAWVRKRELHNPERLSGLEDAYAILRVALDHIEQLMDAERGIHAPAPAVGEAELPRPRPLAKRKVGAE